MTLPPTPNPPTPAPRLRSTAWRRLPQGLLALCLGVATLGGLPAAQAQFGGAPGATAEDNETAEETIAKCLKDLQSPDADVRKRAVLILGKYDRPSAKVGIMQSLGDTNATIRLSALVSLTEQRLEPGFAPMVLAMVGDPDVQVRRHASYHAQTALLMARLRLNDNLRDILLGAFTDPDATVRKNMISNYGYMGDLVPPATLLKLVQDPEREVRILALNACEYGLSNDLLGRALAAATADTDRLVRLRVAEILGGRTVPGGQDCLETLAKDPDPEVAIAARLALFQNAPSAAAYRELRPLLDSPDVNLDQGRRLIALLPNLGSATAEPLLVELLKHPRQAYRLEALRNWVMVSRATANTVLLDVLADEARPVREEAVRYLRMRGAELSPEQIEALTTSAYADIRAAAVVFARELADPAAEPLLMDLILDDDAAVRSLALLEIGRRQLDDWQLILSETLLDDDTSIVLAAAESLIRVGTPEAIMLVENYLRKTTNAEAANAVRRRLDQVRKPTGNNFQAF